MALSKILCSLVLISIIFSVIEAKKESSPRHGWWNGHSSEENNNVCNAERGVYFAGIVLKKFRTNSLGRCCNYCINYSSCYSYSYHRRYRICYLVSYSEVRVYNRRYISGLVRKLSTLLPPITLTLNPVTTTTQTVTTTPSTSCFVETNINYNNATFLVLSATSYSQCCNLCGITAGCASWTWFSLTNSCNLKSRLAFTNERIPLVNAFSGLGVLFPVTYPAITTTVATTTTVAPTTTVIPTTTTIITTTTTGPSTTTVTKSSACFVENDFFYTNSDIKTITVAAIGDCCNLCGADASCMAWSFFTSTRLCSLKNALPTVAQRIPFPGMVSGTVSLR